MTRQLLVEISGAIYHVTVRMLGNWKKEQNLLFDDDEDRQRAILRRYAIRRPGTPEDVAGLVTFLCSPAASWITGQTYPVNGGYTLSL
jgi:3-oxoacyl-[acyl-carrier protein] reductase